MKQILKFWEFLLEAKNLEVEEGRRAGNRIVNFLKKSGFEYRGPSYDSNILINFKTGKYDSIIPPVALGGKLYQSPQGAYCFDLNGFKEKLFGDGEISPENLDIRNIVRDTDIIYELGFGYGNDERKNIKNLKGPETIGLGLKEVPRYMYLYKLREGANIFSRMTNNNKYYDPIRKLITYYSHLFKKDMNNPKFSINDKKENLEIKKLAPNDWINYFNKTKDGWNEKFLEALMKFLNSFKGNNRDPFLHMKLYNLVMECAKICEGNHYLVFTVICNGIGICGFTQRRGEVFIHDRPEFQTLLVNRKCVEDYDIIDLLEMRTVEKATGKMKKDEWNKFIDSLQEGDLVKNKKNGTVKRFPNNDLKKIDDETLRRRGTKVPRSEDYEKTNLDDDGIYQFVNKIKPGDYIKMILRMKDRTRIYVWEFKSIEDKKFGKDIKCEIYAKGFFKYDEKPKQKSLGLNQLEEMSQGGERSKFDVKDDLDLYNILKKFSKKRGPSSEFQTSDIKLQIFREDLDKPLREYVPENFPKG